VCVCVCKSRWYSISVALFTLSFSLLKKEYVYDTILPAGFLDFPLDIFKATVRLRDA
jgi:hypothetical protein